RFGVGPGGHAVAADLAHELQGGGADLVLGGLLVGSAERLDRTAHDGHDTGRATPRGSVSSDRGTGSRPSCPSPCHPRASAPPARSRGRTAPRGPTRSRCSPPSGA